MNSEWQERLQGDDNGLTEAMSTQDEEEKYYPQLYATEIEIFLAKKAKSFNK